MGRERTCELRDTANIMLFMTWFFIAPGYTVQEYFIKGESICAVNRHLISRYDQQVWVNGGNRFFEIEGSVNPADSFRAVGD